MVDSAAAQASLMGQTLGNYRVRALIGRGAMGTVYLADDIKLERRVALKVLLGSLARNPQQVGRFQREAQAAAPLQHLNIVRIYEAGIRSGVPFIAMEFVEGEPLDRFLRRNGTVTWQQGLRITEQVAEGLACAHEAGVVHRDVKPANILLDKSGRVRLTDFGIARMRDRHTGFTEHDTFLGTPEFMSPEQCAGSSDVGQESDIFSLGVVLFSMLSGRLPFTGETTVAVVESITSRTPERLTNLRPDIPDDVSRLVAHMIEKEPRNRPHDARAVINIIRRIRAENGGVSAIPKALDQFIREQSQPRTVSTPTPTERTPHRKRFRRRAGRRFYAPISRSARLGAAAMVLIMVLGVAWWQWGSGAEALRPAPVMAAALERGPDGHLQVPLPDHRWTVSAARWLADDAELVLEVSGRAGAAAYGRRGVLSYNVIDDTLRSLVAPVDATSVRWSPGLHRMVEAPHGTYLEGSLLLTTTQERGGQAVAAVWSQGVTSDRPSSKPVCVSPVEEAPGASPFALSGLGQAVPAPDGSRVAVLMKDSATGNGWLAERAVQPGRAGAAVRRTDGHHPIVMGSVQYAPDGSAVTYVREDGAEERALWHLDSPGDTLNGTPLLVGNLTADYAWSPDGRFIACTVSRAGAQEVLLLDVARGRVTQQFGPGAVSAEAWHPSGSYFLMEVVDGMSGNRYVSAMRPGSDDGGVALLPQCGDTQHTATISRDGRWAAIAVETSAGTRLTLVDLTSVFMGMAPQSQGA